ncbi:Eco57I restriction-modification methylase domain-containing protein [Promicromonospora sp. NFX87]|uniref:Eco57I restriction-modification methylase domain-containing protein n=1 Tax=Promicromonospora sp. NFX87 TaxID=3402691 RepID=UPI003AFA1630
MADAEAALLEVLAWVRDVTPDSPALRPIVGVSDSELRQLARLAALLRGRLADDAPADLVAALTADAPIEPSAAAVSSFDRLVKDDAVDKLAHLYAVVVKPANRRPLGTFFTPRSSAKAIVDSYASRHDAPAEVVDVGAGVGIFSEIARAAWPNAGIHAIDINPLTLGLQAVAAAGRPEWNVRLELADYRLWLDSNTLTRPTLYLGNPPYTRWQLLDGEARVTLLEATKGLVGARANLSTLFLAMTLAKLRREDSLAMIIPAGWMRADYGKNLRSHLRAAGHRRVSLRLADSWRFDRAIVDAVLVEIGPEALCPQPIEVSDWSGSEQLTVSRSDGQAVFPAPGRTHPAAPSLDSNVVRLGEFARVTRGTASGANGFFVKPASDWDRMGIPATFRRALARRLRPGAGTVPLLEVSELLVLGGYERDADPCVQAWIDEAETAGIHEQHLCAKRARWYDLSAEVKIPEVIISALARDVFHVFPNTEKLAITNNLFGLYWAATVDGATKAALVDWLRSDQGQAALKASSSVEANGLHRLSPKAIAEIEISCLEPVAVGSDRGFAGTLAIGKRSK